jgi:2-methylcitrate dehydratase PrpD
VDCALALAPAANEIEAVGIETYGPGYEIVRNPRPATPYQAKFSIAYCVAAAMVDGRCGLDQFAPERIGDPAVARLLERTTVTVADDLTARYPAAWPCRLSIRLRDGRTLRAAADFPRGNPENAVATAELEAKFRELVAPRFGSAAAERGIEAVRRLESHADAGALFCDLVPATL